MPEEGDLMSRTQDQMGSLSRLMIEKKALSTQRRTRSALNVVELVTLKGTAESKDMSQDRMMTRISLREGRRTSLL